MLQRSGVHQVRWVQPSKRKTRNWLNPTPSRHFTSFGGQQMARASIKTTKACPVYYVAGRRHGKTNSIEMGVRLCQEAIEKGEADEGYAQVRFPKYLRKV